MQTSPIRTERVRRGWTQTDLAKEVGVCRATVQNWEGGKVYPKVATAKKLAAKLGLRLEEVLA